MIRAILITLFVLAGTAHAQQPQSEADRLFEEGRALAKESKFAEACEKFDASFKIDPTLGTELNLADCHEHLGHLRKAWELFDEVARKSAETDDQNRTKFAKERADTVAGKLATIVVHLPEPPPAAITITVSGRTLTGTQLRELVEPGDIEVTASVPDRKPFSTHVTATAGATLDVSIPSFQAPPRPEQPTPSRGRVHLAYGLGAVGTVSAIVAGVLTIKARSDYNDTANGMHCSKVTGGITCDAQGDSDISKAQHLADVGTVFAIGSAALVGTAVVLYVTRPHAPPRVSAMVTPDGAGLFVRGSF